MGLVVDLDSVSADVLGDAAGLAGGDVGLPDCVQQRGLAVVDVTHDDNDRGTADQLVFRVLMVVEQPLLDGDDNLALDLAAQLRGDKFRGIVVDILVDRRP